MVPPWKVPTDVEDLLGKVKENHPHLADAYICLCFDDSKAFSGTKLNLGKVLKFSSLNKLWQAEKYDFCIVLCSDVWYSVLLDRQREALLDLQLARCRVEYLPAKVRENGKTRVLKDKWGRIEYTKDIKLSPSGDPIWKVSPLDFQVLTQNVRRYGLWFDELMDLKDAIEKSNSIGDESGERRN